jgi:NADPH2:quinone reductase
MAQMKAVVAEGPGEPEVLRYVDVGRPAPRAWEVLIEVEAAGVNYADTMRRRDRYLVRQKFPFTPGSEVAGTVVEVGEDVGNASEGDRVVTLLDSGGYADFAVAPGASLIPIPKDLGFEEAEGVLVHAAAGGVGTLAVQMARLLGAGRVIATAGSPEKLELASSLGADVLIDYTREDWPEKVLEATDGEGADVILEMVGADFPEKNLRCLATFGRMVVYGAASGDRGRLVPGALMNGCQSVVGFWLVPITQRPDLLVPSLEQVLGWIAAGDLELTIGAEYPLERAAEAHADLEGRKTTGKLILRP